MAVIRGFKGATTACTLIQVNQSPGFVSGEYNVLGPDASDLVVRWDLFEGLLLVEILKPDLAMSCPATTHRLNIIRVGQ